MEPTEIYGYLSVQAGALGERSLAMYPPLQITTGKTPAELLTLQRASLPAQAFGGGCSGRMRTWALYRILSCESCA